MNWRTLARQCKKTGVWEYCDTENKPDENDDEEFGTTWQSSSHSQMQSMCDDAKGSGKGAKGGGKA